MDKSWWLVFMADGVVDE